MRKRILDLFYKTKYGLAYIIVIGIIWGIMIGASFCYGSIIERVLIIGLWLSWVSYTCPFIKYI